MEIREYNKVIPEHVMSITEYVASDGKVFKDKEKCVEYEKKLDRIQYLKSHPVAKSERELTLWPDGEFTRMYYLGSKEDYRFLLDELLNLKLSDFWTDNFDEYGPGFYFLICYPGGDYPDNSLCKVSNYVKEIDDSWNKWLTDVQQLENSSMQELSNQRGD